MSELGVPRSSARTVSSVEALVGLVGSCALLFSRTIDRGSGRAGVDWVDCQRVRATYPKQRTNRAATDECAALPRRDACALMPLF